MKMLVLFPVFWINHYLIFCKYFLYFPAHSEKFVFIISDFSPHLSSFHLLFSPFFFYSHRRNRIQEIGKRSGDGPIAILPGVIAPHKSGPFALSQGQGVEEAALGRSRMELTSCETRKWQLLMGCDWDNHLVLPKLNWKRVTKAIYVPSLERCHSLSLVEGDLQTLWRKGGWDPPSAPWHKHTRAVWFANRTYLVTL